MGEGNTLAGAKILDQMFKSHGEVGSKSEGGGTTGRTRPVIIAGGEYVVHPHAVWSMGKGDYTKGHKSLDAFVLKKRQAVIKKVKSLPGPQKD
jgi:hypothetical protein